MICPRCGEVAEAPEGSQCVVTCARCRIGVLLTADSGFIPGEKGKPAEASGIALDDAFMARFRVERLIGEGATARVYLARQNETGEPVAIKFLARVEHLNLHQRFALESRLLTSIRHPRLLHVLEAGEVDGRPYLVSELCEGGTLRSYVQEGRLPVREAIAYVIDVLNALDACHSRGVVHRDVKPENVLLASDGTPKLADLGIARELAYESALTPSGALLGTPRYMAPEQIQGERVGAAADLYSVGAMLFELIAGRPPFLATQSFDLLRAHLEDPPPSLRALVPGVPAVLEVVVTSALAKVPADRPASAPEFASALRRCVDVLDGLEPDVGAVNSPLMTLRRTVKRMLPAASAGQPARRSHRRAGLGLALAVVAGLSWLAWAGGRSPDAARVAEDRRRTLEVLAPASALMALDQEKDEQKDKK